MIRDEEYVDLHNARKQQETVAYGYKQQKQPTPADFAKASNMCGTDHKPFQDEAWTRGLGLKNGATSGMTAGAFSKSSGIGNIEEHHAALR